MKAANIYLNFSGNAEEAFNFYRGVFGGEFLGLIRFSEFAGGMPNLRAEEQSLIAHVALRLGQSVLMASDTLESLGQSVTPGNNYFVAVDAETGDEAERVFAALSEGGSIAMPIEKTEWAEKYGICTDRFGIQWMVGYTGSVQYG